MQQMYAHCGQLLSGCPGQQTAGKMVCDMRLYRLINVLRAKMHAGGACPTQVTGVAGAPVAWAAAYSYLSTIGCSCC